MKLACDGSPRSTWGRGRWTCPMSWRRCERHDNFAATGFGYKDLHTLTLQQLVEPRTTQADLDADASNEQIRPKVVPFWVVVANWLKSVASVLIGVLLGDHNDC